MLLKNNILKLFLEKPTGRFQLRELARITKISTTAVKARLRQLLLEKIVKIEREKQYVFYKANWDAPEYKWTKKFYNIMCILKSGLLAYLDEELHYPEAIILFGSAARGEDAERSDIDVFVLCPNKKEIALQKFEKRFGKPIRLQLFNRTEFKLAKDKNKELINNIINGVILKGYLEVL